jgi:IS5 family transposase
MKNDGKLGRNYLLGTLGDAINALLCGAGHNLRLILKKLRAKLWLFFARLLGLIPNHAISSTGGWLAAL